MTVKRPVLRYHGGKWRLAPWLIKQMPAHRIYVEPFGGAASVLMRKPRAVGEIYNDLDGNIVNVFRILRDPDTAAELERLLRLTPFSREEFKASYEPATSAVDSAWKTIVRSFMGFSTDATTRGCKTGFRANKSSGKLPAQEWSTYAEAIPAFTARLQGVVIECRNAFEVIAAQDTPETLFFVDPPYVDSTRGDGSAKHGYVHEMSDPAHRMLSLMLRGVKGKVLLCGYKSRLYEELYPDWRYADAKCYANGAHERHERIWMNYPA
jgi:DNA adenine methylase